MPKRKHPKSRKGWILVIIVIVFINFYPLPYYFTQPGDAKVLNEIIKVEGGYSEEGSFMLTTVRQQKATIVHYVWAKMSDYHELYHEDDFRLGDESDEEYHHRQLMAMSNSKDLATFVAYNKAGKEAYIEDRGVLVTGIIEGMSAEGKLEQGDKIIALDGEKITKVEELFDYLSTKQKDDEIEVTVERDENTIDTMLVMDSFPEHMEVEDDRAGIGIRYPVTERVLIAPEPEVTIDTRRIGGPSAGLMFTLEIYNQLVEEDITKGYEIAGTGTISEEAVVGPIGGVHQKVVAADNAGTDIFFAPAENGSDHSDYIEAVETAKDIKTEMKIVPVNTFDDALQYLEKLEVKGA